MDTPSHQCKSALIQLAMDLAYEKQRLSQKSSHLTMRHISFTHFGEIVKYNS
jgi:hypothetical protein